MTAAGRRWPTGLAGARAALRIARREALRAKGRSALVIALIALPIFGMGAGAVVYDSFRLTPEKQAERRLGAADAAVQMRHDRPVTQIPTELTPVLPDGAQPPEGAPRGEAALRAVLPPGSRLIPYRQGQSTVRTRTGIATMEVRELDYANPIARGLLTPTAGRAPRDTGEVAVTEAAAARTGVRPGDRLRLAGDDARGYRVVGIVEDPARLSAELIVGTPGARLGDALELHWLVDTPAPLSWSDVQRLNKRGMTAVSRQVLIDPPPPSQVPLHVLHGYPGAGPDVAGLSVMSLLAGAGVLQIVLLAGPAFAIGARRRQRDLALVAVNGGAPAHLRRIVLADGVVLGLVGAVAGLVLAVASVAAGLPLIEEHLMDSRAGGLRVFPAALAGIAGLAVLTGVLAALLPAVVASRQSIVAALAGRRGITRSRRRWLALGLAATGIGMLAGAAGAARYSVVLLLAGLVLAELGLAVCTPALIGAVSRISGVLPLTPRMALRTTSRIRSAAAPAVAAVMASAAAAIAISVMGASEQAKYAASYQPDLPSGHVSVRLPGPDMAPGYGLSGDQVATALRQAAPVAELSVLRQGSCASDRSGAAPEYCSVLPVIPPAQRCPYDEVIMERDLTPEETTRFREDKRCGLGDEMAYGAWPNPLIGDGSVLGLLTGADPDRLRDARRVLDRGGVVVGDHRAVRDGRITLEITRHDGKGQERRQRRIEAPAYLLRGGATPLDGVMISPAVARRLSLKPADAMVVARPSRPLRSADEDRLRAALADRSDRLVLYVERGPRTDVEPWMWLLAGMAGLITLGAAAIATGLVAADGRAELSTLAAVGAAPRLRRALMLAQSGVIAGIGTGLGGLAGAGAAAVLIVAGDRAAIADSPMATPTPFTLPWPVLLLILLAAPLVAMLGAGLFTRSRLPIERRLT